MATRANREDECRGHFFEQRFQAERIHDLFGLMVCGLYVDLNEIAAGIAHSPHDSTQTSVFARLRARKLRRKNRRYAYCLDGYLAPVFERDEPDRYPPAGKFGALRATDTGLLDIGLDDYVDVLTMLIADHRKRKQTDGAKPPLPKDEIESLLSKRGLLANITADIAI